MSKFIMLCGIPGSGKTTLARELSKQSDVIWVYSDGVGQIAFLGKHIIRYDVDKFIILKKQILNGLEDNKTVVYDATNLNHKRRMIWLHSLPKDTEKICYKFIVPLEECIERDSKRDGYHKIGASKIIEMYAKYENPTYDEGWDAIIDYR